MLLGVALAPGGFISRAVQMDGSIWRSIGSCGFFGLLSHLAVSFPLLQVSWSLIVNCCHCKCFLSRESIGAVYHTNNTLWYIWVVLGSSTRSTQYNPRPGLCPLAGPVGFEFHRSFVGPLDL